MSLVRIFDFYSYLDQKQRKHKSKEWERLNNAESGEAFANDGGLFCRGVNPWRGALALINGREEKGEADGKTDADAG